MGIQSYLAEIKLGVNWKKLGIKREWLRNNPGKYRETNGNKLGTIR